MDRASWEELLDFLSQYLLLQTAKFLSNALFPKSMEMGQSKPFAHSYETKFFALLQYPGAFTLEVKEIGPEKLFLQIFAVLPYLDTITFHPIPFFKLSAEQLFVCQHCAIAPMSLNADPAMTRCYSFAL